MSLIITSRPSTTRSDTTVCKASHGFNSVYFDVAKPQNMLTSTTGDAGFLRINFASAVNVVQNAQVYFWGADASGNVIKNGIFTVLSVSVIAPYYVVLITPVTAPANLITTGFLNELLTTNEKITVTGIGESAGVDNYTSTRIFSYAKTGVARVYINSLFNELFAKRYLIDNTIANHIVKDASFNIELDFTDVTDSTQTIYVPITDLYSVVNSVEQISNDNRAVNNEVYKSSTLHSTAKWLTAFEIPCAFRGYDFGLCALIGPYDTNIEHKVFSGSNYATELVNLLLTNFLGIHYFKCTLPATGYSMKTALVVHGRGHYLDIDEAGHDLLIDENGNKLLID